MEVSVLIPTHRRPRTLGRCLDHLAAQQDAPPFEVVVAIDGDDDYAEAGLERRAGEHPYPLSVLPGPKQGQSAALNRALERARGRIALVIGDDIYADPRLVARHHARQREIGDEKTAVLGKVVWHPDLLPDRFLEWEARSGAMFAYERIPEHAFVSIEYLYACNVSLDRKWLAEIGGFDGRFQAWTDTALGYRAGKRGLRLYYEPDALGYHDHAWTLQEECRRQHRKGKIAAWFLESEPAFAEHVVLPRPDLWRALRYGVSRAVRPLAERSGVEAFYGWCWIHALHWSFARGLAEGRRERRKG